MSQEFKREDWLAAKAGGQNVSHKAAPEAFVAELRTVLENVQTELSATGRHSARIQRCIEAMPSLAATLRQQAARVDAPARITEAPFYWERGGGVKQDAATGYCNGWNDCLVALEAALSAQPAPERQGAVGEVTEWEGSSCIQWYSSLDAPLPVGTKLYTHTAAPVGVPDGMHKCRYCDGNGFHLEEHEPIAHEAREMLEFLAGRMEFAGVGSGVAKSYARDIRLLLAAPSAPQGTQQGEGVDEMPGDAGRWKATCALMLGNGTTHPERK